MLKNLILLTTVLFANSAFADVSKNENSIYDKESFCTYEGKPYSIGSPLQIGKDIVKCLAPGVNRNGSYQPSKTAHWD